MHRQEYFLALDQTANEFLRRFDQKDLNVVIDIENLLLKCSNECEADVCIPESLIRTYQKDLNFEKIKQQLKLMPDLILGIKK